MTSNFRSERRMMFSNDKQILPAPSGRWRWQNGAIWCLALVFLLPLAVQGGSEYTRGSDTVRLSVDSRWPGNSHGGYVPIRIKLTNLGASQEFQVVFSKERATSYDRIPEVRRTVQLDQNATRDFTLSIPMVSYGNSGELRIYDGRGLEIEELSTTHTLPVTGGENARTSLLVITSDPVDAKGLEAFENAAATECAAIRGLTYASGGGRYSSSQIAESDHLAIPPVSLPENWIDYSGIEVIAVSWSSLNGKLKTAEREALLKWAACGGTLIIYGTEKPAGELEPLGKLLQLDEVTGKRWIKVDTPFAPTAIMTAKEINMGVTSGRRGMPYPTPGRVAPPGAQQVPEPDEKSVWTEGDNVPSYRDWSFGRLYVFPKDPFNGTANDWVWFLTSLPQHQSRLSARLGMSSRIPGTEFLNFLIPGVGSVPVHAFLVLITIFTIVIGPLNYYWLRKQRRLGALVFTVPLIASVACILLFFYSLIADGFSIRSRVHSVTLVDQQAKSAVSQSRLCLYAPFAPSAGLKFSSSTAVFPIWQQQQYFEGGVVDWTGNDQSLKSGWFRSQTWTQFLTIEQRDERGRLDYPTPVAPDATQLKVSNGYSWDLEYLAIEPSPGQWFVGENIPAGASAELNRVQTDKIVMDFSKISKPHVWSLPEGLKEQTNVYGMYGPGGFPSGRYMAYGRSLFFNGVTSLSSGQLRQYQNAVSSVERSPLINRVDWRNGSFRSEVGRHTEASRPHFWAVCRQNPGIQIGVENAVDKDSYHLLFGVF